MNEFVWDMNFPGGKKIDDMILWNGTIGNVKAAPGKYMARFKFMKDSVDVLFVIKGIPDQNMTQEDYNAQVNFLLQIRDKFNGVQTAIQNIRALRKQMNDFVARLDAEKSKMLKPVTDSINKRLTKIEEALYQTKAKSSQDVLNYPIRINDKLSGLFNVVASGYTGPSKQSGEVYADLSAQADEQLHLLDAILKIDIPALNTLINMKIKYWFVEFFNHVCNFILYTWYLFNKGIQLKVCGMEAVARKRSADYKRTARTTAE
jgi:hypothetical protein